MKRSLYAGSMHTEYPHSATRSRYCFLMFLAIPAAAYADIATDGSLGLAASLVPEQNTYTIAATYGQQHGGNLFHSFARFGLSAGEIAAFSVPAAVPPVTNIISRITNGEISRIDGTLRCEMPGVDLYFFNPAGMVFGAESALDIQGSLYVSSADYLKLGDEGRFYAAHSRQSTLSSAPPEAFGFLAGDVGSLSLEGTEWQAPAGKTIAFTGGDIEFKNSGLKAADGTLSLVSMAEQGEVPLLPEDFEFSSATQGGGITLKNDAAYQPTNLEAGGEKGGRILILGGRIVVDSGFVLADTQGGMPGDKGQGISVQAQETLVLSNTSIVSAEHPSENIATALADTGDIVLQAPLVRISEYTQIRTTSQTSGAAGKITVSADNLWLTNGAQLQVNAGDRRDTTRSGTGQGGHLFIDATESVRIHGEQSALTANVFNHGAGGSIDIQTSLLELRAGAEIQAGTNSLSHGDGGNIKLDTAVLQLSEGSEISAESQGQGKAGDITIHAEDLVRLQDSAVITRADYGNGGNITLASPDYVYFQNSEMSSSVFGSDGQGGSMALRPDFIVLDNSRITAHAFAGNAGNIHIKTKHIFNFSDEPAKDVIIAKSRFGLDGNIEIESPEQNALTMAPFMPSEQVSSELYTDFCRIGDKPSYYTFSKHGGMPDTPERLRGAMLPMP
ncbi:MAG: filamentous hemagglutinin N-terminal domain-containing protein [Gammaproteobacteria bacterium]|nr:filamentous hemagglutinin N-terminal domain-containing protein [Gammaproteobacteria bacterium]